MKKFVINAIEFVAVFMFIVGVIMFFVCIKQGDDAGRGYYSRDPVSETMWYIGAAQSFMTVLGSFLVFGFSYIVRAACKYLDRCEIEEEQTESED